MNRSQRQFKKQLVGFGMILVFVIFIVMGMTGLKAVIHAQELAGQNSQETVVKDAGISDPGISKFAFLAAAIAVGVGSLGAGIAVGYVGAAAMGALGEKPELAGKALLFVGLAEGIAIYGLIIAIMILGKV
ncbi:hypothetical protein DRQ07_05310 [candidate division KSB1 bacterium]|nr:MAG: hypothetical protein DRQ07_05310 [candidate division KSB1 bacterium]